MSLQKFPAEIRYKPGSKNTNADELSRNPLVAATTTNFIENDKIKLEQTNDIILKQIII